MNISVVALAVDLALGAIALAMVPCIWRVITGPHPTDRVLALDTLYLNSVSLVVLLGIRAGTPMLFEAALLIAMLGFATTVALARYISRGAVVE